MSIFFAANSRLNTWIIIGIYITIFINSFVLFKAPFEFYIGYIVYIFLLPGFIRNYGFNKNLFFIFFILLVVGLFNIYAANNTLGQFLKVYIGLFLAYLFYYYIVVDFKFNIKQLFKWYLTGAYIVCLIGLFQFISYQIGFEPGYNLFYILNKWRVIYGGNFGIRLNSVFSEPTYLAATISSAFFVSIYNLFSKENFHLTNFQSLVIILVYLLSFSGLGQVGVFLTLIFLGISFGLIRYIVILIPVVMIAFNFLYNNVNEFKTRYDGTISLFSGEEFVLGTTHGSSYILYNNYTVALKNFTNNPLFGGGLGSHVTAFDKYSLAKNFRVKGFDYNGQDASSMFLRLMSETGIFGLGIFLIIIIKCYVKRNINYLSYHWLVSNAILIMILLNLFRQGHYFLNGFPFFIILYYYNSISYKNFKEEQLLELN